ncbi:hypothetical protein ACFOWE_00040 [Planomonospora corallina]|uniref:DUF4367 domain-containing protein n=1 Tax=Planomonospora corallina TaxID=1806052 RepID=A0ABV8I0D7_9ACTN
MHSPAPGPRDQASAPARPTALAGTAAPHRRTRRPPAVSPAVRQASPACPERRVSPVRAARRTAAAVAAVLAAGVLAACGADSPAASGGSPEPRSSAGAHRLVLPPPQKAGALRLDGMWPFHDREELLERRPHVGDIPVRDAVQVRYEEIEKAEGRSWTRAVVFTGYEATVEADRRQRVVDDVIDGFLRSDAPDHDFDVPAESFGGGARCVGLVLAGSETGLCAWADDGTVGVVSGANFTAAELKEMLPDLRAAVER